MKVVHSWLKEYVGDALPDPEKVAELLTFHSFEIEGIDGEVIDVDVLPNRGSDSLCHRGIARELATLLDVPLAKDPIEGEVSLPKTDKVSVDIADEGACRRFGAVLITGVEIKESPEWLRTRLEALGQRSINNVVDATNYVMLALGQPLHAYDADKFENDGTWQFGVRFAREGEKIVSLSGDEYELDPRVQLIVNKKGDVPASLAGIKGGTYAEVDEGTVNMLLEAANFDPAVTRKSSQFLKLQTDASKRFENEPSRELVPYALKECAELIAQIAGGKVDGMADAYPEKEERPVVQVDSERVNALLGLSLSPEEMRRILVRIGAEVSDNFEVRGPWERSDLNIEEDYVEEIGRVHGYSAIAAVVPDTVPLAEVNSRHYYSEKIRRVLMGLGFSEVITSSFRKKDQIRLLNALASDKEYLRSSLRKNIEEVLEKNISFVDLLGLSEVRVFEFGTVFEKAEGVAEHVSLALGVRKKQQHTPKDDAVLAEAVAKIEEVLGVSIAAKIEKGTAEINFSALLGELPVPEKYEEFQEAADVQYQAFSLYPHVSRDIALWVDEGTDAEDVLKVLRDAAGELCVRITLFDEFSKDGRMSYAFRLVFQSYEKTLTDEEVQPIMDRVYSSTEARGWEVR